MKRSSAVLVLTALILLALVSCFEKFDPTDFSVPDNVTKVIVSENITGKTFYYTDPDKITKFTELFNSIEWSSEGEYKHHNFEGNCITFCSENEAKKIFIWANMGCVLGEKMTLEDVEMKNIRYMSDQKKSELDDLVNSVEPNKILDIRD